MSVEENVCPKCNSPYAYPDGFLWICPECAHEWSLDKTSETSADDGPRFLDARGDPLQDGDTVITIRDLKAGKDTIKIGTKVKNIRLLGEPVNGHEISCKIKEFGALYLTCAVVKKA